MLIILVQTVTSINKLMLRNLLVFIMSVCELLSKLQISRVLALDFQVRGNFGLSPHAGISQCRHYISSVYMTVLLRKKPGLCLQKCH